MFMELFQLVISHHFYSSEVSAAAFIHKSGSFKVEQQILFIKKCKPVTNVNSGTISELLVTISGNKKKKKSSQITQKIFRVATVGCGKQTIF